MGPHFSQVTVIADVVPDPVFINIDVPLGFPREPLDCFERFEDGAAIALAAPQIINFSLPGCLNELINESCNIVAVNVVSYLFPFVAKDLVLSFLDVAFDQVAQEAMEFDARNGLAQ